MVDVSIIITAYNYDLYIEECVSSCLNQTGNYSFEVIVIDDGSSDDTRIIAEGMVGANSNLFVHSIQNSGIEKASNFGFRHAKGKYIVRVDADDKLHPQYLEYTVPVIQKNNADFVYTNYFIIDKLGEITERMSLPAFNWSEIIERGDFLATGTLYNAETLKRIGMYNEKYKNCGLENYELMLNFYRAGCTGILVEKDLFYYRRHNLNISELKRNKIIEYGRQLFRRTNLGEFKTNGFHPYKLIL